MFELEDFYGSFSERADVFRGLAGRPLTFAEKVLFAHLGGVVRIPRRGVEYAVFRPDRVAMQDATAQMAMLQFINTGRRSVCVPTTIHCDHLIRACKGAENDLPSAMKENAEVYGFLSEAASCSGIGFWKPGSGIIHQEVLENYAFPGGMMVGTDSHTPNAGGLGMVAVGVGGSDAVDVMTGMDWELKVPRLIGVRLTGSLRGWASAKDVILALAGILTVKGGTNAVIEYFGPGARTISCTGKATICNMGAEVGATCSIFPYDSHMSAYLRATGRGSVADVCDAHASELTADSDVENRPQLYFDRVIELDLSSLEPYVNGPFTPDAARPVSLCGEAVEKAGWPGKVSVSLIGSCTNSSYQDLTAAAQVVSQALAAGLRPRAEIIVNPGSERIRATAERDGLMDIFRAAGATIMTNACGPCIGQWKRITDDAEAFNTIVTTFNRNFAKRADGNPNTHAFIVSPQMAAALAFAGRLDFNPAVDDIDGFRFAGPEPPELPEDGFAACEGGYVAPEPGSPLPLILPESERLQKLEPFSPWNGKDLTGLRLLIKTRGKCTTDHISMAGKWLKYRGHLENISRNLLMGATNSFNGRANEVRNFATGEMMTVSDSASAYKASGIGTVIVAEDNYGEGSSREHAAMEPRFLGVRAVVAKSFARIHETNLKKQGVLALTFASADDYDKVREDDLIDILCARIAPSQPLKAVLRHSDGSSEEMTLNHTYNGQQIGWFKAGSALNCLKD